MMKLNDLETVIIKYILSLNGAKILHCHHTKKRHWLKTKILVAKSKLQIITNSGGGCTQILYLIKGTKVLTSK